MEKSSSLFRDLELGVVKVHILYHAVQEPFYGSWMLGELGRHGYSLSYGTLYPTLHKMEADGLLKREELLEDGKIRKYYSATERGEKQLRVIRSMIGELYAEVVEGRETNGD